MAADAPPLSAERLAAAIALIENDLCASADMLDADASEAYAVVLAAAKRALAQPRKPASDANLRARFGDPDEWGCGDVCRAIREAAIEGYRACEADHGIAAPPTSEPQFYLWDTRAVVGNCALWWRPNREGYTCDLAQAGRYTETEARDQERVRSTDRAVPCELAESITQRHVHVDTLTDQLASAAPAARAGGQRSTP